MDIFVFKLKGVKRCFLWFHCNNFTLYIIVAQKYSLSQRLRTDLHKTIEGQTLLIMSDIKHDKKKLSKILWNKNWRFFLPCISLKKSLQKMVFQNYFYSLNLAKTFLRNRPLKICQKICCIDLLYNQTF